MSAPVIVGESLETLASIAADLWNGIDHHQERLGSEHKERCREAKRLADALESAINAIKEAEEESGE